MNNSEIMTDKSEFLAKLKAFAPEVYTQVVSAKSHQISEYNGYGCKEISGKNHIRVFEAGDQVALGVRNVDNGQTPADKYVMLTTLRVRTASILKSACTGKSDNEIMASLDWEQNAASDATLIRPYKLDTHVANGEVTISADGSTYMEKQGCCMFDHNNTTALANGEARIPSKLIKPLANINVEFDLAGAWASDDTYRHFIRVDFIGQQVTKA